MKHHIFFVERCRERMKAAGWESRISGISGGGERRLRRNAATILGRIVPRRWKTMGVCIEGRAYDMQQKGIAASIPQVQYEGNGNGNSYFGTDPA